MMPCDYDSVKKVLRIVEKQNVRVRATQDGGEGEAQVSVPLSRQ